MAIHKLAVNKYPVMNVPINISLEQTASGTRK